MPANSFFSTKEAPTPVEVHLTYPCGLQSLPIYHIWNELTLVPSVKWTETLGLLLSYSHAFFACSPHFVETWTQKFLEAPSLS